MECYDTENGRSFNNKFLFPKKKYQIKKKIDEQINLIWVAVEGRLF